MKGFECGKALDNDINTFWHPTSMWHPASVDPADGKISYTDHWANEVKCQDDGGGCEKEIYYSLTLAENIGIDALILHQFNMGHGVANKIR